ncbi:MAG: alpha/beta hydrolase [Candidatus Schekmanbacteria bacterium]|nr:alpha/beta hydrolase [Candidatus Schekmanbacteria bacterium]
MVSSEISKRFVTTSFGRIACLEAGDAERPPVLFIHGIPTSSYLWRHVMKFLQNDFYCIAPDLMGLGDTEVDPDAGCFDMEAQAEMLLELMDQLGRRELAVVCHDQGGAAAQLIAARQPQRVSQLVLTDCVCYDNWPVPAIAALQRLARLPLLADALGRLGLFALAERYSPLSSFRRGMYDPSRFPDTSITEYLRPLVASAAARKRFFQFLLAGSNRHTLAALDGLRRFDRPTLILWAADDAYLSPSWGVRLYEDIPGAQQFTLIPFCGHFWQEERPAEFASKIGEFLAATASPGRAGVELRAEVHRSAAACSPATAPAAASGVASA